ncbi:MAG: adenylate/guanylate cyclase domain-containing protein [Cyanobacteriota bacterium]|nr:adenylate/guanylate cyclase domain-containing protein [Cyanobacteriota bacterium]
MTQRFHPILNSKIPLRLILVVPFVVQIVLGVGLVGYLSFRNGQRAVEDLATQLRQESTERIKERLDNYLQVPHLINQTNADALHLGELDLGNIQALEQHFWQQIQRFDSASYIYFGSATGFFSGAERGADGMFNVAYWSKNSPQKEFETYATNEEGSRTQLLSAIPNYEMLTRPWYETAVRARRARWGEIYVWEAPYPNVALPAVMPFYNDTGVLQGVFAVDLSLLDIGQFLQGLTIGRTGQTFIMERDGLLVATSTSQPPFTNNNGEQERVNATKIDDRLIRSTAEHLLETFNRFGDISQPEHLSFKLDGDRQLVQVTPYRDEFGLNWSIVVVVPEADFMGQIHKNNRTTLILCAIAFILTTGLGIVTSHWITQPILQLGRASRRIANGELRDTLETDGDRVLYIDELKVLSDSFYQMAHRLNRSFTALEKMNERLEQQVEERTEQLAEAEAEMRGLFKAMTELIFIKDRQGRYLKVVSGDIELLHSPVEVLLGKAEHDLFPPERADRFVRYIQRVLDTQQTARIEYSLTLSGQEFWFAANISPIDQERVIWVARDISARKRVEAAVREKEQYLRLILNNIPQQVFWKDTDLVFRGCNRNWAKAAGLDSAEAVVGKTDYDLIGDRNIAETFRQQDRQIIETHQPQLHFVAKKVRSGKDGKPVWLDMSKIPIHDTEGRVVGVLGVLEDITLRKLAEEALRGEQEKSEALLLNILPKIVAQRLKQSQDAIAEQFEDVTILFADIVGFTPLSARLQPIELVNLLNRIFSAFDRLAEKYGLEKIKTIGDAYMVVGGLPVPKADRTEAIANMALEMIEAVGKARADIGESLQIRIGINTGPVVAGVIGIKKFIYDLWGDAVNVASRMEASGQPGKIQVTAKTYEQLKAKYVFEKRGVISVKGKGKMTAYWLLGRK